MAIPSTHPPASRLGVVTATAANAPGSLTSELRLKIAQFGGQLSIAHGWVPRSPLPKAGDECLVAFDEHGDPWVIAWR